MPQVQILIWELNWPEFYTPICTLKKLCFSFPQVSCVRWPLPNEVYQGLDADIADSGACYLLAFPLFSLNSKAV